MSKVNFVSEFIAIMRYAIRSKPIFVVQQLLLLLGAHRVPLRRSYISLPHIHISHKICLIQLMARVLCTAQTRNHQ